ncbi:MAG: ABC transporter substrate-binding protein [Dehalococcoidia bacterium]
MSRTKNLGPTSLGRPVSRRSLLRASGLAGSGLIASAFVGCGDDDDDDVVETPTTAGAETATVKTGGEVHQGWNVTTKIWNPYETSSSIGHHYTMITDTLVRLNPETMAPEPAVVEGWEIVQPGLEYVLKVRQGVKWHDKKPTNGRTLTAEDVAYTLRVGAGLQDPANAAKIVRASSYRGLDKVEVTSPTTVKLSFTSPNSAILNAMGDWRQYVIPVEMPDQLPWTDPATFPGVGPFVCNEYRDGERISYTAFKEHWDQPYPYVDRVTTQAYGDRASMVAAMISGDIDTLANVLGVAERKPLEANNNVDLVNYPYRVYQAMFINSARPALQDPKIWKAFQLITDYKGTNDAVSGDGLWNYTGPFLSVFSQATQPDQIAKMPGFNPATKDQDIAEAKKLMEAAGHKDGQGLSLVFTPSAADGEHFDVAVRFQAQAKKVFPEMKLDLVPAPDAASFQRSLVDRSYDLATYLVYEASDPRLALNSSWYSTSNRNYGNNKNSRFDALVDKSFTVEGEEAVAAMKDAEKVLLEDGYPMVMMKAYIQSFAVNKRMTGYQGKVGPGTAGAISDNYRVSRFMHLK